MVEKPSVMKHQYDNFFCYVQFISQVLLYVFPKCIKIQCTLEHTYLILEELVINQKAKKLSFVNSFHCNTFQFPGNV